MSQIYELYLEGNDNWKSRAIGLLDSKVKELGPVVNDLDELSNKKENKCGLISFDFDKIGDPKNIEKLNALGLNSYDDYINIHFKSLFEQKMKDPSVNINQMHESLSLLADRIIDEYPQTKAIIGRSWIMDSVVGKRLKFKIFDKHEGSVFSSSGFWGQFIDENGYIKKDEMNEFLSTGEAKFYPTEALMIIEDFLKEYLPENRKINGYVKLMEYTDEAKKFSKEIDEILFKINKDFKILSYDEVVKMVRSNKIVSDYLDTENGQEFLKMFKQLKDSGLKSMDDLIYEDKDRIKNNFNSFLNKHKSESIEKEVFIGIK